MDVRVWRGSWHPASKILSECLCHCDHDPVCLLPPSHDTGTKLQIAKGAVHLFIMRDRGTSGVDRTRHMVDDHGSDNEFPVVVHVVTCHTLVPECRPRSLAVPLPGIPRCRIVQFI